MFAFELKILNQPTVPNDDKDDLAYLNHEYEYIFYS